MHIILQPNKVRITGKMKPSILSFQITDSNKKRIRMDWVPSTKSSIAKCCCEPLGQLMALVLTFTFNPVSTARAWWFLIDIPGHDNACTFCYLNFIFYSSLIKITSLWNVWYPEIRMSIYCLGLLMFRGWYCPQCISEGYEWDFWFQGENYVLLFVTMLPLCFRNIEFT